MLLAGLDIGTTGCKVTVYGTTGDCLGRAYRDYPHARMAGEHEVDPGRIWDGVRQVLAEAAAKWPEIGAIGVTSFGESFVLTDENGAPLGKVMLYTDPRGEAECEQLCNRLGRDRLAYLTGVNPHPMYSISKLMWVKARQPEVYAAARHVCLMADYVAALLTGAFRIDHALAARTMAFDIRRLDWSDEILLAAGISLELFSPPVPTGSAVGGIMPQIAAELGLAAGTPVVLAGHDQVAAAVGSGVFDAGAAVDGAGTVECITPVFTGIPEGGEMTANSYATVPYVEAGKYVCYAFSFTGGAVVKWFNETLAGYAAAAAKEQETSLYYQLEGTAPLDGPTGLLVLPHFAGAATPYMDTGSKGAILGLTLETTQRDIFLAIMEGVCYEMRLNMDCLKAAGVEFHALRATGGGANSPVWMQMKADVLNVPVTSLQTAEAGGAGAAMMAGVAAGVFPDLRQAAKMLVRERQTFAPRPQAHALYTGAYERYKRLYGAVRPLV